MSIKRLHFALALSGLLAITGAARAESPWEQTHGRRDEVNDRLAQENERIREDRREHELNGRRAHELNRREHEIRGKERSMAAHDGGHITPAEQRTLNRQENHLSREIGQ